MNQQLLNVAIAELPAVIGFMKVLFARRHPDAPEPSEAEIRAAFDAAFAASLEKDDRWLSAHPG